MTQKVRLAIQYRLLMNGVRSLSDNVSCKPCYYLWQYQHVLTIYGSIGVMHTQALLSTALYNYFLFCGIIAHQSFIIATQDQVFFDEKDVDCPGTFYDHDHPRLYCILLDSIHNLFIPANCFNSGFMSLCRTYMRGNKLLLLLRFVR